LNTVVKAIKKRRTGTLVTLLSFSLLLIVMISASMGYVNINTSDVGRILLWKLTNNPDIAANITETARVIILDIRLPRILTCAAVGGALALSGTLFQGILLNPLADPYTLGVSAGAAFGACIAIILNLGTFFVSIPLFAFVGAISTLVLVIFLSGSSNKTGSNFSSNNLILSGIIIAAILSAGISFLKYIADEQVSVIIFWLMGSFASKTWVDVVAVSSFLTIGFFISILFARDLNIISLGEKSASSLGVDIKKVVVILLVTGSLLAAISVSVSGIIGFVGLLIPHMVRLITGPDNLKVIPISMISGAILLVFADTITRAVLVHEIPIGVLTALIGGPVFCWIFKKSHQK